MDSDTPVAGVVVEGVRPQWSDYGGYQQWASNVSQPGDYPEPITYFESETQNFVLDWAENQISWDDNIDPTNPYAISVFAVLLNKEADIYHTARYWAHHDPARAITGPITGLTGPQWLDIQSRTTYELTNDPLSTGAETLTFNGHLPGQTSWHIRINPFHSNVQDAMGTYGPYRGIEYIVMHEMGHATPAAVEFFRDYDHLPQAQLAPLLELFADAAADSMFEMFPTDYGETVSSGYTPRWAAKGTAGDDLIAGVLGPSFIWGSGGIDTVTFSQLGAGINADLSLITAGAARLNVYLSVENLTGTAYNDTFYGSEGDNSLSGGGGSDVISGNEGNDYISGGDGNDYLLGNGGFDTILGNTGNDTLLGGERW